MTITSLYTTGAWNNHTKSLQLTWRFFIISHMQDQKAFGRNVKSGRKKNEGAMSTMSNVSTLIGNVCSCCAGDDEDDLLCVAVRMQRNLSAYLNFLNPHLESWEYQQDQKESLMLMKNDESCE